MATKTTIATNSNPREDGARRFVFISDQLWDEVKIQRIRRKVTAEVIIREALKAYLTPAKAA